MMNWRPLDNFYSPSARYIRKNRFAAGKIIARLVEIIPQAEKSLLDR
jgi:hypothetical protein